VDTSEAYRYWRDADFSIPMPDVNGDSFRDIFLDLSRNDGGDISYTPVLFLGGPGIFDTIPDWFGELSEMRFTTNVGDYDGDGRDDVTRRPLNGNYFGFYRSADPMPSVPTWTMDRGTGNTQYGSDHTGMGDFNGDGFSDFGIKYGHIAGDYYANLDLFLDSPTADSLPGYVYQWGTVPQEYESRFHFIGDVNNDGYDDLVSYFVSWWTGNEKRLYYGGDPFDFEADGVFYHENIPRNHLGLGDINHDGYDDFVNYEQGAGFEVYLGGNPPILEPVWSLSSPFEGMDTPYRISPAGDFNGDGTDDWMFSCYEPVEARGRIIVVAGDEHFGQAVGDSPALHPSSFLLHPCYPNPFNNTVTIPFEITGSRMQTVSLTVVNMLGQTVQAFEPQMYSQGMHVVKWDVNGVSSGTYYIRAMVGEQIETAAVRLVK
jgi:hypothetical protein